MTDLVRLEGQVPYARAHELQKHLLEQRIAGAIPDTILFLEHESTITVGRAKNAETNVLQADVPVVRVERGGDVTWHGPGQLVAYPIVDLRHRREDLHAHLHALEDAVIDILVGQGLDAHRDDRNTGVWLPGPHGSQKVCSIGIACRRWVTWHGLALNIDPDPTAFTRINPCGFEAGIMTRLVDHLDPCPTLDSLVEPLASRLTHHLEIASGTLRCTTLDRLLPSE